jgi:hypothetical protein
VGKNSSREGEAASQALAMLDEIEAWWQTQTSSAHIFNSPVIFSHP